MIVELQSTMSMVRRLNNFEAHEDGRERGGAVREKAKALLELMGDNARLREERIAAKEHRTRFMGGGGRERMPQERRAARRARSRGAGAGTSCCSSRST